MLTDPKMAGLLSTSCASSYSSSTNFSVTQGDANRVTRVASNTLGITDAKLPVLTVARSVSSENKGQLTDRIAIRLQASKSVTISDADATSTAQATLTMSIPRYGFTAADITSLVAGLVGYISTVDDGGHLTPFSDLSRVIAGEA